MSHKTVYMGIPASKLSGGFSIDAVSSTVDEIMKNYVEETAEEENIKCDWYVIGGRWQGAVGAVKGSRNVLPAENGQFAYAFFDQYDAIVNGGRRGPYVVDDTEYIPISGGIKKNIAWDAVSKLDEYKTFRLLKLILDRDPRIGDDLPEGYEIAGGDLYAGEAGQKTLVLKSGESFPGWAERLGITFGRVLAPPDAFIDTDGVWHDENEIWDDFETILMNGNFADLGMNLGGMPDDPQEAAPEKFRKLFEEFMDSELKDDDCFVILDCHCFP